MANPDRAERCAFTLLESGLRLGVGSGVGLTLTLALTLTLTVALTLILSRYVPDLKSPDARLRRGANHERFVATPAAAPRHDAQRAAFNKYDTNHSGELDHKELRKALETVGLKITSSHAATLLAKYDKRTRAAWWSSMSSSSSARGSRQPWDSTSPRGHVSTTNM